jgi:hypothetical protein
VTPLASPSGLADTLISAGVPLPVVEAAEQLAEDVSA